MNKRRKQNLVVSSLDVVGSVGIPFVSGAVVLLAAVLIASRYGSKST